MNSLDLIILAVVGSLAALGYAQGFVVGVASLLGIVLGGAVGTRVTRALMERAADDPSLSAWAPLIGLAVGLLITIIGAMAMQDLGAQVRRQFRGGEGVAIDHMLGAVLLTGVGLVIAWFAAAAAIGVPQMRPMRSQIVGSQIVRQLNAFLPDVGPVLGRLASYDPFPTFDGGSITIDAPDPQLPSDPEVAAAAQSVVRVVGSACGYRVTGSGWVATAGYVVTNAHVVAGQSETAVQVRGQGELINADVTFFDDLNDLAVLRVTQLDLPALERVAGVKRGSAAVVLGYPENRGFQATAARFDDTRDVSGPDIYGEGSKVRSVTSFRGLVRHGNSGGPLVDGDGNVLSTVFASTVGENVRGGYGIPNELAEAAVAQARRVPEGLGVRTGPCIA